uniref:Aquaporin-3 n=1 Tax=Naja naja TaxID=35670 RepID=A0A8C6XS16_NAJNA
MGRQKEVLSAVGRRLRIRNKLLRQALAECLGTLILVVRNELVVSRGLPVGFESRGHLNPAVTFAMCVMAREPWIKLPIYALAQTIGAFLGAGIVFGLYFDAIWAFGENQLFVVGPNGTAGIFATYPSDHLNSVNGFFDQFIGTAALIVCVLAIVDPYNNPVPRGLEAFTVGFVILVIGTSMGFNSGYAVNPARDLGPRLFTAIAGWGTEGCGHWWWIPLVAPFLGAIAGVLVYQLMIGCHDEPPPESSDEESVKLSNVKQRDNV